MKRSPRFYTAVTDCLAFGLWNSVPESILSHIG